MKKYPLPIAEDESDRKLLADIERVGWHLVGIPADKEGPGYVFSVGLQHTFDQPEILIIGLEIQIAGQLLNAIGEMMQAGSNFTDSTIVDDLADGFPMAFRTIAKQYYRPYVGYALWFYESSNFPLLQCLWPDRASRFPWDANCNQSCCELQRLTESER